MATADYVEITDYKGVLGGAPRSCAAWVKTSGTSVQIMGWGLIGTPLARWIVGVDDAGRLWVQLGQAYAIGTKVINDDDWHHIAVVLAGPSSNDLTFYVDGRPDAASELISATINTLAGANVSIGVHPNAPLWFNGLIDNVCIYDRALTAEEVTLLAASADYWEDKQYWRPSARWAVRPASTTPASFPN